MNIVYRICKDGVEYAIGDLELGFVTAYSVLPEVIAIYQEVMGKVEFVIQTIKLYEDLPKEIKGKLEDFYMLK